MALEQKLAEQQAENAARDAKRQEAMYATQRMNRSHVICVCACMLARGRLAAAISSLTPEQKALLASGRVKLGKEQLGLAHLPSDAAELAAGIDNAQKELGVVFDPESQRYVKKTGQ